ncbi:MAG: hypothetical protein ACPG6V_02365 [Flavobacteriales bacterium]
MHKLLSLIFFSFLCINIGYSQSQKSFDKLVHETKENLQNYSKLNAYEDNYLSIDGFGLSKKEKQLLIENANYDATLTQNKDSITSYHMIWYYQEGILENIKQLIEHSKFQDNKIEELLIFDPDLFIVVSDDRKLFNFSLDEKTGGTYRSRISIMYFTDFKKELESNDEKIISKKDPYSIFSGDGFNSIYALQSETGTKYVLTGYVRGCSYCFEEHISLVSFNNNTFKEEFSFSVNSRSWDEKIIYDPIQKKIEINYKTDDLTPICFCNDTDEDISEESSPLKGEELKYENCQCTFYFNGKSFEIAK